MKSADYLLGLLAIISGLAIADMVVSLHHLLISRRSVRWDWLSPVAAAYVFLMIVFSWGISYQAFNKAIFNPPVWVFIVTLGQLIAVYLAARASLPDDPSGDDCDLAAYYERVSRFIWSSIAVCYALLLGLSVIYRGSVTTMVERWSVIAVFVPTLALAAFRQRAVHRILVPGLLIFFVAYAFPRPLLGN